MWVSCGRPGEKAAALETTENTPCRCVQVSLSRTSVATDTLPYLATIVAPSLRAVPGQMLTAREQTEQANLVNVMLSYKLAYELTPHALEDLDGKGTACLKPAVDMLLSYPEVRAPPPFPPPARRAGHI